MADGPRRTKSIRPLKKAILDGPPIEMRFSIPLETSQQKELTDLLRPLLSHGKRRVTVRADKVVIEGVLVRDSKPVRDALARFREAVCPRPIHMRGRD